MKPRHTAGLWFAAEILHMLFGRVVMVPVVMLFMHTGFSFPRRGLGHGKPSCE